MRDFSISAEKTEFDNKKKMLTLKQKQQTSENGNKSNNAQLIIELI